MRGYYKLSGQRGQELGESIASICEWLQPKSYLEIGVDGGESLQIALRYAPSIERLALCDIWDPQYCEHGHADHKHIDELLAEMGYKGQVRFLSGDSKELVPSLTETFDLATVDGGHDYETALSDTLSAWAHLAPGGVIIIHDVDHYVHPGVMRALLDWLCRTSGQGLLRDKAGIGYNIRAYQKQ